MTHGLVIFTESGKKILDTSDELGRLIGFHEIIPVPKGKFTYTWNHPELSQFGDLFIWFNPNFSFNYSGNCNVAITGTTISLSGELAVFNPLDEGEMSMIIFYGVK